MKTILYLNGKKTTHRHIITVIGEERLDRYIRAAKHEYFENPLTQNDFMIPGGMLLIRFE